MLRFFTKTKVLFICALPFAIGLGALLFFPFTWAYPSGKVAFYTRGLWIFQRQVTQPESYWVAFSVALFAAVTILLTGWAAWLFRQIMRTLLDECNPPEYLRQLSPMLLHGRKNEPFKRILRANYAIGLHAAGDTANAVRLLEDILARPAGRHYRINDALLYRNLVVLYCRGNFDLKRAKTAYEAGLAILHKHTKHRLYGTLVAGFHDAANLIRFGEGDCETSLHYFTDSLPLAKSCYDRVSLHNTLAEIYGRMGDTAQKKAHLEYVAKEGNTLSIAFAAREFLQSHC